MKKKKTKEKTELDMFVEGFGALLKSNVTFNDLEKIITKKVTKKAKDAIIPTKRPMTFAELYKKHPPTHEERIHGWTNQKSRCGFAHWCDCSFWCSNPKFNPKEKMLSCRWHPFEPDFERCKNMKKKLK